LSLPACFFHHAAAPAPVAIEDSPETAARRYREAAAHFDYAAAAREAASWRALAPGEIAAALAEAESECSLADVAERDDDVEAHVERALAALRPWLEARASSEPAALVGALEYTEAEALGLRARLRGAGAAAMLKTIYAHAKAAADLDPGYLNGAPRRLLAILLVKAPGWPQGPGDFDAGTRMLEEYVLAYPQVPEGFVHLADAYLDGHRVHDAEVALARARPLLGRSPRAQKLFAQTHDRLRMNHSVKSY
jgi:hypothetical protein